MMLLLRSLVFNVTFAALNTGFSVYGVLTCYNSETALALAQRWARSVLWAARRICHIELEISGQEHMPRAGAALIASMHQSAYDTIIWLTLVPRVGYVMKQELARTPLFGRLTVLSGMIPLDRAGGAAALRGLMRSAQRARDDGRQIVVFPEGTRARPGSRGPLHPGIAAIAAATGLPVIPVRIDSGLLWGRKTFFKRPGTIHMEVQKPLPPGMKRAALMEELGVALRAVENPVGEAG